MPDVLVKPEALYVQDTTTDSPVFSWEGTHQLSTSEITGMRGWCTRLAKFAAANVIGISIKPASWGTKLTVTVAPGEKNPTGRPHVWAEPRSVQLCSDVLEFHEMAVSFPTSEAGMKICSPPLDFPVVLRVYRTDMRIVEPMLCWATVYPTTLSSAETLALTETTELWKSAAEMVNVPRLTTPTAVGDGVKSTTIGVSTLRENITELPMEQTTLPPRVEQRWLNWSAALALYQYAGPVVLADGKVTLIFPREVPVARTKNCTVSSCPACTLGDGLSKTGETSILGFVGSLCTTAREGSRKPSTVSGGA
eukprot:RCo024211